MSAISMIPRFHRAAMNRRLASSSAHATRSHANNNCRSRNDTSPFDQSTDNMVVPNQLEHVTLKVDLPHTDHSHVIGRGGRSIKAVMQDTSCHIHFPDSNRASVYEKSNQVSISGKPEDAEKARQILRQMLPLVCSFELYVDPNINPVELQFHPRLTQLQQMYNVQITFRRMHCMQQTRVNVLVKGLVSQMRHFHCAMEQILGYLFGNSMNSVQVSMDVEVDPKHHSFVLSHGGNGNIVKAILHEADATVSFPDNFTRQRNMKKTTVVITGSLNSVLRARQILINSLPVVLSFDIFLEEYTRLNQLDLSSLNTAFDVSVTARSKMKQDWMSIVIRTTEKNVLAVYQMREFLLNLIRLNKTPTFPATVPTPLNSFVTASGHQRQSDSPSTGMISPPSRWMAVPAGSTSSGKNSIASSTPPPSFGSSVPSGGCPSVTLAPGQDTSTTHGQQHQQQYYHNWMAANNHLNFHDNAYNAEHAWSEQSHFYDNSS